MKNETIHQYKSPLKFLNYYAREDYHLFYGRTKEVNRIFTLFEKTNLVVVYGPSGSGKSSVALCGLTNRHYNWNPIIIRKNENIIDSFFEEIEVLFSKQDCLELKQTFQKISEAMQASKTVRYKKETTSVKVTLAKYRKELEDKVEHLFKDLKSIPFFIFDQFEELFIQGTKGEIASFSLLLSLITSKILLSNIVLCIQTEFFAHLLELEPNNPNILDYKCLVDDPTKDDVAEIIRKTFESFDINQREVSGPNEKGEVLSKEVQERRVDLIIKKLGKKTTKNKVHLPFLQIYLNKLYIDDFIKTYPDDKDLLYNPSQIDFKEKPLEFTDEEIKIHGNIVDILVTYLNDVNEALITNTANKIQGEKHKHTVIKLLKHFVTEKNTKRAIEVEGIDSAQSNYLEIKDLKIKEAITQDIWFDTSGDTSTSLVEIIDELINARILKENGNFIELSHNLLARVIAKIPVDKDILDNYKYQFKTAFANYQNEISEFKKKNVRYKKSQLTLLNPSWVKRIGKDIDYIIPKSEKESERRAFWNKSEYEVRKKRLRLIALSIGLLILSITSVGFWIKSEETNKELTRQKTKLTLSNISNVLNETGIDRTQGYLKLMKVEEEIKRNEFNPIDFPIFMRTKNQFIADYINKPFYLKKIKLPDSISDRHIYSTKSRVLKSDSNKLLLFAETSNHLYSSVIDITNQQSNNSNWYRMDKRKDEKSASSRRNRNPFSYKPYKSGSDIRIVYSDANGIFDNNYTFDHPIEVSTDINLRNLSSIEHLSGQTFIAIAKSNRKLHKIDLSSSSETKYKTIPLPTYDVLFDDAIVKTPFSSLKAPIKHLKKISDNTVCFLANLDGRLPFLLKLNTDTNKIVDYFNIELMIKEKLKFDHINSLQVDQDHNAILIADERFVYSIRLDDFNATKTPNIPKISSKGEGRIKSMSSFGDYTMLGSDRDLTAIVYYDENLSKKGEEVISKELIGHTDAIHNVSFREVGNKLCGITSGQDGSINIWDLSPLSIGQTRIIEARDPISIGFNNDSVFAGFTFNTRIKDHKKRGYMVSYDSDLNEASKVKHQLVNTQTNSNVTSFDFTDSQRLVVGTDWNKSIRHTGTKDPDLMQKFKGRVLDVKILGNKIAVATYNGLHFGDADNLEKSFKAFQTKIKFNSVDIHPNKGWLLGTSDSGKIYLWNPKTDNFEVFEQHDDYVKDACFSKDGTYFVSGSWDNSAYVWKSSSSLSETPPLDATINGSYYPLTPIFAHTSDIETVAINDSNVIALGSSDKTVSLHQLIDDKKTAPRTTPMHSMIRHEFGLRSIDFDPDGIHIYTVDRLGHIKKWNYTTFEEEIEKRIPQ